MLYTSIRIKHKRNFDTLHAFKRDIGLGASERRYEGREAGSSGRGVVRCGGGADSRDCSASDAPTKSGTFCRIASKGKVARAKNTRSG